MYLGQVIGTVVCTKRVTGLEGARFLLVQPLDHQRQKAGPVEVAVDRASASPGTLVLLEGSREAALACDPWFVPVDSAIVGIVDEVDA
ncbi:MAG: EutN/CcmL family microcompartment protein [Myxococcales bacterium]|nr:EutN/CcmL family microcompartment protein [Myxococcales bacterium]